MQFIFCWSCVSLLLPTVMGLIVVPLCQVVGIHRDRDQTLPLHQKDPDQTGRRVANPYNAEILSYKWRSTVFLQFEIIINVLVSSFYFIWIPVLRVYGHYKYFNSFSSGIHFIRQNLTSTDVRFWRIKSTDVRFWRIKWVPALKG